MKIFPRTLIFSCVFFCGGASGFKYTSYELPRLTLGDCEESFKRRSLLTISCKDTAIIPKVPNAGKMFSENGCRYQCMHNGINVLEGSYYGRWMHYIIQELQGHHEPQEEKVFFEVLKGVSPGAAILELGSYWAYYSMWFLKNGGGSAYLVEPIGKCREWGIKNFELNGLFGTFICGYISDYDKAPFNFSYHLSEGESAPPAFTVDEIVDTYAIDRIAIVHSDVQGAECAMLKGSQNSIKNKIIDYFFISTHGGHLHSVCLNFLIDRNFHIIAEHSMTESVSADGLIVAEAPHVGRNLIVEVSK